MKETDILVIGGGPAALITSVVAAQMNPGKKITTVRNFPDVPIPCAIPYSFGQLGTVDNNLMPDKGYVGNKVDLLIDEAVGGNLAEKTMELKSGEQVKYDRLVIATGSKPIKPSFIPGLDQDFVFVLPKDNAYLRNFHAKAASAKKIVIIGGGFIGMEFADEFMRAEGKEVTLVEMMPHVLMAAFDEEICAQVEEKYAANGCKLMTGKKVMSVGDHVVNIEGGEPIPADLVLVAIGAYPDVALAEKLGLTTSRSGIWVDEYLRTSNECVFAVGDCAAKTDFFTRRPVAVMLASTACAEARIAGSNLFSLQVVRENKGTIGIFSTQLQGITLATAGLTERVAKKAGFEVVATVGASKDRHPGKFTDTSDIKVKLIFSKSCGVLLGGQVISGGKGAAEMINAIGIAVQQQMRASELFTLQFGTHPLLTSAPTTYPLITAAQAFVVKMRKDQA